MKKISLAAPKYNNSSQPKALLKRRHDSVKTSHIVNFNYLRNENYFYNKTMLLNIYLTVRSGTINKLK